jgi:hypothetical protein
MQRRARPIQHFRRRLWQLIEAQFEGKYTLLATRARIPISSMQHYVHSAKRLPGGEHLLRIAEACGVSVHFLVSGADVVGAHGARVHPTPVAPRRGEITTATHRVIPVLRCTCPGACPVTADVLAAGPTAARIALERDMAGVHGDHRLMAVEVTTDLPCPAWPTGTRLVVDRDAGEPRWEAMTLIHVDGRCQLGHVARSEGALLFAGLRDSGPRLLTGELRILGTAICVVAPL